MCDHDMELWARSAAASACESMWSENLIEKCQAFVKVV